MSKIIESFYKSDRIHPQWLAFRSQGYPSAPLSPTTLPLLAKLPAFLRTLLITDGTVTRSLESFFWEPITIEQLKLEVIKADQSIPWLNINSGEELLLREVQLLGQNSQHIYTTAYSLIRLQKVPGDIRDQLIEGGIGIGVLISQFGVESFREILDIGCSQSLNFNDDNSANDVQSDVVYRSYRILVKKEPIILITEKFPIHIYQ